MALGSIIKRMALLGPLLVLFLLHILSPGQVLAEEQSALITSPGEEDDDGGSLIQVEDNIDRNESHVKSLPDLDNVFQPTHEWQELKPDETVLPGLHFRINMETKRREAKLLDGDDGSTYQRYLHNLRTQGRYRNKEVKSDSSNGAASNPKEDINPELTEEIRQMLKNIKSDEHRTGQESDVKVDEVKSKLRSYKELKENMNELHMNIQTENEIMIGLLKRYNETRDEDDKVSVLEELTYLVHQIDNAVDFAHMGGIAWLVRPATNSSRPELRAAALHLLGTALQSNPKVQVAALECNVLSDLLRLVALDKDVSVQSRAVFAISAMVRHFPYGQRLFIQSGGLTALGSAWTSGDNSSSTRLQLKIITLLYDLLMEREAITSELESLGEDAATAERSRENQLLELNLAELIVGGGWCDRVTRLLPAEVAHDRRDRRYDMGAALGRTIPLRADHDQVQKVVEAMSSLASVCGSQFSSSLPSLRRLAADYVDLAFKEGASGDPDFDIKLFEGISSSIDRIIKIITIGKDEL